MISTSIRSVPDPLVRANSQIPASLELAFALNFPDASPPRKPPAVAAFIQGHALCAAAPQPSARRSNAVLRGRLSRLQCLLLQDVSAFFNHVEMIRFQVFYLIHLSAQPAQFHRVKDLGLI